MNLEEPQQPPSLPQEQSGSENWAVVEPDARQFEHGQPQQPYAGYPVGPPPKKRTGLIVGGTIAGLIVLAGIGAVVDKSAATAPASQPTDQYTVAVNSGDGLGSTANDDAPTSAPTTAASAAPMSVPASAGGLVLLTSSKGTQLVARLESSMSKASPVYVNALIGAYGPTATGDYRMALVAQPFTNLSSADQSQMASMSPSDFVGQLTGGMKMTNVGVETSSDADAAISCGTISTSGVSVLTCVWDDDESFGLAYFYDTYYTTGIADAAKYTDALRAAAEGS